MTRLAANLLVFGTFWPLAFRAGAAALRRRGAEEWLLDLSGLVMQGLVVPLLQAWALYAAFGALAPSWRGSLELPALAAFLLNVVGVDYLYYWNHRLLHGRALWDWHAVHHTAEELDVWATSRNTLWSPFLIVYVWVNAAIAFLLRDPEPFLLGAAATAALDLWRHSGAWPKERGPWDLARLVLVTPAEHAWHHSADRTDRNFAANFSLWDRLHGTYHGPDEAPERLGVPLDWDLRRKWLLL